MSVGRPGVLASNKGMPYCTANMSDKEGCLRPISTRFALKEISRKYTRDSCTTDKSSPQVRISRNIPDMPPSPASKDEKEQKGLPSNSAKDIIHRQDIFLVFFLKEYNTLPQLPSWRGTEGHLRPSSWTGKKRTGVPSLGTMKASPPPYRKCTECIMRSLNSLSRGGTRERRAQSDLRMRIVMQRDHVDCILFPFSYNSSPFPPFCRGQRKQRNQ